MINPRAYGIQRDDEGTATDTGWLAKQFIRSPKQPLKFYMDEAAIIRKCSDPRVRRYADGLWLS